MEVPRHSPESRSFLLQRVQPPLSDLMDGSLSTLAPIVAVWHHTTWYLSYQLAPSTFERVKVRR